MDSKLQWTAILSSLAVIFVVMLAVLWSNQTGTAHRGQKDTAQASVQSETQETAETGSDTSDPDRIGSDMKAFERDEGFFDPETNAVLEAARDMSNRLSLIVTSIEKDLRIQIIDTAGNLVTGESFYVELERADGTEPQPDAEPGDADRDAGQDGRPEHLPFCHVEYTDWSTQRYRLFY